MIDFGRLRINAMNKVTTLVALLATLILAGCGANTTSPTATPIPPTTPPLKVALVMKTLTNPFFVEMEKGARKAESELGIQLIVRTAAQETSIEQQISIIDDVTRQKVDAIVVAPGDSKELIPVLKKAQDAGIKIVNIDNRLDRDVAKSLGLKDVPFISVDNVKGSYLSAKYIASKITSPVKAVILEGIQSAQNAQDRKSGAVQAFKENSNITVVDSQTANWKIDEAHDVTKKLFAQNPDIKVIFAANDMMALGAIQYLNETNKTGVMVAGYDALKEAKDAIKAGTMLVTIDQQAAQQGYLGVEYAVKLVKGETVPLETYVDVLVVDQQAIK